MHPRAARALGAGNDTRHRVLLSVCMCVTGIMRIDCVVGVARGTSGGHGMQP